MAAKEKTVKERLIDLVETMDEAQLLEMEKLIDELTKPSPEEIERRLAAWRGIFGLLSEPEEYAEFEKHARRNPLFDRREEKSDDR